MDCEMPVLNGLDSTSKIIKLFNENKFNYHNQMKIVICSANETEQDKL